MGINFTGPKYEKHYAICHKCGNKSLTVSSSGNNKVRAVCMKCEYESDKYDEVFAVIFIIVNNMIADKAAYIYSQHVEQVSIANRDHKYPMQRMKFILKSEEEMQETLKAVDDFINTVEKKFGVTINEIHKVVKLQKELDDNVTPLIKAEPREKQDIGEFSIIYDYAARELLKEARHLFQELK